MNISELKDGDIKKLIKNRWEGSSELWNDIERIYDRNKSIYLGQAPWLKGSRGRSKLSNGRIFTDTEAVINSVINNTPKPNILPMREDEDAITLAANQEKYFTLKYEKLGVKEELRRSVRDLYFSRLMVLKPFWNADTDDIDVKRINPKNVRFSMKANSIDESDFAIEEIEISLVQLLKKYAKKEKEILEASGFEEMSEAIIANPLVKYKECWIEDRLFIEYKDLILWKGKNPMWDWDGLFVTKEENNEIISDVKGGRSQIEDIESRGVESENEELELEQGLRKTQNDEDIESGKDRTFESYLFNHFDVPRKPYIFATILKNEDGVIGNTSFIEMASPLAEAADKAKIQINKNAKDVNGILKVEKTVMTKAEAEKIMFESGGLIHGKGVMAGVKRESGNAMPAFVFEDMKQSLEEIDNVMAASSAFRGEREGQETRGGRLALIDQSYLRLNELVQTIDYVSSEIFNWWYQLAKVRYTENHMIKVVGEDKAIETIELSRNDMEKGAQVRVIPGKTLPEDKQFKFQRSQSDVDRGVISHVQYLTDAGYDSPMEVARNAFEFTQNPAKALGMEEEQPEAPPTPEMPPQQPMPQMPPQLPPGMV